MSRQYPTHSSYSAPSGTRSDDGSAEQHPGHRRYGSYPDSYSASDGYTSRADRTGSTEVIEDFDDIQDLEDFDDYVEYYEDAIDRRWIWVAGVAGAILLVAVICTVVILGGGDSGSVSKTISPPADTTSAAAPTTSAAPPVATSQAPAPLPLPSGPLTPETVTTVTPEPTVSAEAAPPTVPAPAPRTVTYTVTGTRQLIDLVTVIYTDEQGALQTDLNVALPWSKTVALNPGVNLTSVTATSMLGQLNCSITDAGGATIAAQATNSMITTCTK
jgi:hypothetical protein